MKPRFLLLTSDKSLIEAFEKACGQRKAELVHAASPSETRSHWKSEDTALTGVIADSLSMREKERRYLLALHRDSAAPRLLFLDPPQATYPGSGREPIVRLQWPLDPAFLDMLPMLPEAPLVFLTETTLFVTGILHESVKSTGIQPAVADSAESLSSVLKGAQPASPQGGRAFIARWSGDIFEAEAVERSIRGTVPDAHVFLVDSRGPIHAAEHALKNGRPAFLPRRLYEPALDLLLGRPTIDPTSLGRILLFDEHKPSLIQLGSHLMEEGYEVAACASASETFERATRDFFHVAVLSSARSEGGGNEPDLAQRLRELDRDLRIILMVDSSPITLALQGLSQVVEVGLDDCLLKPVEPSRLRFSITRAIDRRQLQLENVRLLRELKETNRELEQLTGFQSKFFAMVAHDVKNPLTAVRGYADILLMKIQEPPLATYAQSIRSASNTLSALVSDLVDFAAIESGKLRVNLGELDLAQVIDEVGSRVRVAAEKRSITLHVEKPERLPVLEGDPLRIGQVIQNLCTNAIQYTPEKGSVHLKAELGPEAVTVSVRDTGIGISKADLPRVFERFFQASNASQMRRAGFGLGLKISQEIVRSHGGDMGVESELGKGSVFRFTLPLAHASKV